MADIISTIGNALGLNHAYGTAKDVWKYGVDGQVNMGGVHNAGGDLAKNVAIKDRISSLTSKDFAGFVDDNGVIKYDADKGSPWKSHRFNESGFSLESVINGMGLTYDRLKSRILNYETINRNKLLNPIDYVSFGQTYIFFTKPDLYLLMDDGTVNPSIEANCKDLYTKIRRNPQAARALQSIVGGSMAKDPGHGFIHLLGSMCTELSVPDMALTTSDAPKNIKGYGIKYGGTFLDALKETTLPISFLDNRHRDVSTMMEIWMEYIEGCNQGKIRKKRQYRDANILDYAISIYIFVVDETNNILAHTALVGCYPKSLNVQLLQHKREPLSVDTFIGPFSYEWQVSHVTRPNSQTAVEMFNYSSGFTNIKDSIDPSISFGVDYPQAYYAKLKGVTPGNNATYFMHQSINPWGPDMVRLDKDLHPDAAWYQHQFTITNYWPQYAGVVMSPTSGQTLQYSLIFYSTKEYLNSVPRIDFQHIVDFESRNITNAAGVEVNLVQVNRAYWLRKNSFGPDRRGVVRKYLNRLTKDTLYKQDAKGSEGVLWTQGEADDINYADKIDGILDAGRYGFDTAINFGASSNA